MTLTDEERALVDAQPTWEKQVEMADYLNEDPAGPSKALGYAIIFGLIFWGGLGLYLGLR